MSIKLSITTESIKYLSSDMLNNILPEILERRDNIHALVRIMKTFDYGLTDNINSTCRLLDEKTLLVMRDFAAGSKKVQSLLLTSKCITKNRNISQNKAIELFAGTIASLPEHVGPDNLNYFLQQMQNIEEIDPYMVYRLQAEWLQSLGKLFHLIDKDNAHMIDGLMYKCLLPLRLDRSDENEVLMSMKLFIHCGTHTDNIRIKAASILALLVAKHDYLDILENYLHSLENFIADLEDTFVRHHSPGYIIFKKESLLASSGFPFSSFFDTDSVPEVIALAGWFVAHSPNKNLHNYFKRVMEAIYEKLSDYEFLLIVDSIARANVQTQGAIGKKLLGLARNRLLLIGNLQDLRYLLSCLDIDQGIVYFNRWEKQLSKKINVEFNGFEYDLARYLIRHYQTIPITIQSLPSVYYLRAKILEYKKELDRKLFPSRLDQGQYEEQQLELPFNDKLFGQQFISFLSYHVLEKLYFSSSMVLSKYLVDWICCEMPSVLWDHTGITYYLSFATCNAYNIHICPWS